jgi:ATP adenylyltransferase
MKNLWSPWRSKYIESFSSPKQENGCIFCDMLELDPQSDDNLVVEQNQFSFVVMNLYPYNNGHLMVVPKRHFSKLSELNDDELKECMNKLQELEIVLTELLNPDGFNIGINLGRVSGAGIDNHIHFHIVPRWNGDTNFMPVLGEVKVISQDLLSTKKNLIDKLSKKKSR